MFQKNRIAGLLGSGQPILYLPSGPNGKGFFSLHAGSQLITAELRPAEARLVYLLDQAYEADAGLPPEAQGWRTVEQLVDMVDQENQYVVNRTTISQYLWRIKDELDEAAAKLGNGMEAPPWRVLNRGAGMRLTRRVLVIDGTRRLAAAGARCGDNGEGVE